MRTAAPAARPAAPRPQAPSAPRAGKTGTAPAASPASGQAAPVGPPVAPLPTPIGQRQLLSQLTPAQLAASISPAEEQYYATIYGGEGGDRNRKRRRSRSY